MTTELSESDTYVTEIQDDGYPVRYPADEYMDLTCADCGSLIGWHEYAHAVHDYEILRYTTIWLLDGRKVCEDCIPEDGS